MGYEAAVLDGARRRQRARGRRRAGRARGRRPRGARASRGADRHLDRARPASRGSSRTCSRERSPPRPARIAAYAAFSSHAQDVPASIAEAAQRARAIRRGRRASTSRRCRSSRRAAASAATRRPIFEDQPVETLDGVEDDLFHWARADRGAAPRCAARSRTATSPSAERASARGATCSAAARTRRHGARSRPTRCVGGRARDLARHARVAGRPRRRGARVARRARADRAGRSTTTSRERLDRRACARSSAAPSSSRWPPAADLLGGVLVEVGDLRVDATARGRLDALREHLTADRGAHAQPSTRRSQPKEQADGPSSRSPPTEITDGAQAPRRRVHARGRRRAGRPHHRGRRRHRAASRGCRAPRSTSSWSSRTAPSASR